MKEIGQNKDNNTCKRFTGTNTDECTPSLQTHIWSIHLNGFWFKISSVCPWQGGVDLQPITGHVRGLWSDDVFERHHHPWHALASANCQSRSRRRHRQAWTHRFVLGEGPSNKPLGVIIDIPLNQVTNQLNLIEIVFLIPPPATLRLQCVVRTTEQGATPHRDSREYWCCSRACLSLQVELWAVLISFAQVWDKKVEETVSETVGQQLCNSFTLIWNRKSGKQSVRLQITLVLNCSTASCKIHKTKQPGC